MDKINQFINKLKWLSFKYLSGILLAITTGLFTFFISTKIALAEHEVKVNYLENQIQLLRMENREDHQELRTLLESIRDKK